MDAAKTNPMPMIQLGRYQVSRLMVGANPVLGFSYMGNLMGQFMTDYFTLERIQGLLTRCLDVGINTWQTSPHEKVDKRLDTLRESGRDIQWVFLASGEFLEDPAALKRIAGRNKPIAILYHGGVTDKLWREGQIQKVHDFTKRVKDLGILAGISAHNPDVIRFAEDGGWDLDLYMACFYRLTRTPQELEDKLGEVPVWGTFLPGDPEHMCEVVRQVERPCLVFKILAGGRRGDSQEGAEAAFADAFKSIKSTDGVIVGMFPRFRDEPAINAELTKRYSHLSK